MNFTPRTFGDAIAYTAATVIALGILWRYIVRPLWHAWRRFKVTLHAALEVIDRELTHNGGSSLKDAVHRTDRNVAELDAEVTVIRRKGDETGEAVEALAQMLDNVVDRKQEDHDELWSAVESLGGQRPKHRRSGD